MKELLSLCNIRRVYALFFFALFLFLLVVEDYRHMRGYEVSLFLHLDPLVAISSFLTSGTVYRGLVLSLLIIVPTLFLGRFFCSWICPLGILNQWTSHFYNKKKKAEDVEKNSYKPLYRVKYYILAALLILSFLGTLQIGLFDPISLVTRSFGMTVLPAAFETGLPLYLKHPFYHGAILIALIFLTIIFLNRFITRFWCRVLCPLGALLGLLALPSLGRIRRDVEKCTSCNECLPFCQGGCDPHAELRVSECHLCMNCIESCPEGALHYGLSREESSVHQPFDINRRRLLETSVASVVLLPMMKSSITGESEAQAAVIRPPGSLPEKEFLNRCIKCGQCMRVCPTNLLHPALLESGLEGIWTPIAINKIGYCEYSCTLCGEVCPTGAIRKITVEEKLGKGEFEKPVKQGTAFYDRGRCLPWAMDIPCIVCEEVCPTSPKAIWFREEEVTTREGKKVKIKRPYLSPDRCIGCGICENRCPVQDTPAIRVSSIGETRSSTNHMILKK